MKQTDPVPDYKFGIGYLAQVGDKAVSLGARDGAELSSYGVDVAYMSNIESKVQDLKDCPSDEEFEGNVKDLTEIKDKNADELKVAIRSMMSRVVTVFPIGSGKWLRFNTEGLNEMDDSDLIKCGYRVVRMATKFSAQLAPKGVTPVMIDNLKDTTKKLDESYDDQQDAKLERRSETRDRILLANVLYALIVELFSFGKDYWFSRNSAKYKDYVIYNTPDGAAPAPSAFGSIHGTMLNSETMSPAVNGLVTIEFIDDPIEVDEDGNFECSEVPVESTKIWGSADGCKLFAATIEIKPDEDTNFDILMEPGEIDDGPPPPNS